MPVKPEKSWTRAAGKLVAWLLCSLLIGGVLTNYLEEAQKAALMPLRNYILMGTWSMHSRDDIPVTRYPSGEGVNPVYVSSLVRAESLRILETGRADWVPEKERRHILELARYFLDAAEERSWDGISFRVWTYNFDYPVYGMTAPWVSGMAQGRVMELLLAAHALSGEAAFLEEARLAANALRVPVETGGVAIAAGEGLWFEEYARAGVDPPQVLNGHIFALNGLWHLSKVDSGYRELFLEGAAALQELLPLFDAGVWSYYDLQGTPAAQRYQYIHARQLREMYNRTGDELFLAYAKRFQRQLFLPLGAFYRIAVFPNPFLVALFCGNGALVFLGGLFLADRRRKKRSALAGMAARAKWAEWAE